MKDSFDVVTDVFSLIDLPAIKSLINGDIYSNDKPSGSTKVDIVVNSLGVTNRQMQRGSANVNIHSPNTQSGRADSISLITIAKALIPYLDSQYRDTFYTEVDDGGTLMRDTDGSWFYNIPINYYSIQNNYQNI